MEHPESNTPSPYAFTANGIVLFDPTSKQLEAIHLLRQGIAPNVFIYGNRGGGKSTLARMFAHAMAMSHPGFKYAILRTSYPELQKTHLNFLPGEMDTLGGEKHGFAYNKTEHIAYYPKGSMGFYAQCATEDDVRKVLGSEFALVIFDEAPTFQFEHMALISASIRVPKGSGITPLALYLGNPIGASINELWARFIDKDVDPEEDPYYNPADWVAFEMRLEDNPHLDADDYRKRLSSGLLPHYRKAWLEGERTVEGALFDLKPAITVTEPDLDTASFREVRKPYHLTTELPTFNGRPITHEGWVRIYRAFDMGFHPDPAVCLWIAVVGKRIIVFHESVWHRTIAKDIAKDIRTTTGTLLGLTDVEAARRVSMTYADPTIDIKTGADVVTIKDTLEINGVPIECSINNREQYAHAIHSALGEEVEPHTPRLQIYTPGCPYLTKSLPRMQFDPKNPARMADHKDDHAPIALAYFLMSSGILATTSPPDERKHRPAWMDEFLSPVRRRRF